MARSIIADEVRVELEDAAHLIMVRVPERASEAGRLLRAVQMNSPMIATRFNTLLRNLEGEELGLFSATEKAQFARILSSLSLKLNTFQLSRPVSVALTDDDLSLLDQLVIRQAARSRSAVVVDLIRQAASHEGLSAD